MDKHMAIETEGLTKRYDEEVLAVDGVDLIPYLTGENNGSPHDRLYWRKLECAAVRDGLWKLIRVDGYGFALYDLKADIAERRDLAAEQPEEVNRLKQLLAAWERDKMQPLWEEGERYKVMRYQYHTERFKTGEIDPKIDSKASKLNIGKTNKNE